ncbi:MAG: SBBP repeat-containing protein [Armatimonadetes bacterium]|nr:SBBP repeat-containing protein [Armatimonadota bacterium]
MKKWFWVSLLLLAPVILSGCAGGGGGSASVSSNNSGGTGTSSGLSDSGAGRTGEVQIQIQWPQARPEGKLIPASTETIEAQVRGDGLSNPLIQTVARSQTTLVFSAVPVGNKTVEVKALDGARKIVAHRIIPIVVALGQTASVPAQLGMTATDSGFVPSSMTLNKGETILLINAGQLNHSVVNAGDGSSITPDLAPGQSFSFQSQSPGTYNFRCGVHPTETGIMTIQFPPPEISGISPGSGTAGTTLTINGNNFGNDPNRGIVTIGGVMVASASISSWTDTRIDCTVPAGTGVTDGVVVVKVNNVPATGPALAFTALPQMVWQDTRDGAASIDDEARRVVVDSSGNVYVAGNGIGLGNTPYAWVKKYNSTGTSLFETFDLGLLAEGGFGQAIALDGSGNVLVAGASVDSGYEWSWVAKYNSSLNPVGAPWPKVVGTPFVNTQWDGIALDPFGNIFVAGWISSGSNDIRVRKLDSSGNTLWTDSFGSGPDSEIARDIAADSSGNAYVTGNAPAAGEGFNIWVRKYDTNQNVLWTRSYNGTGSYSDEGHAICVDALGNVYVTGYVHYEAPGLASDVWVAKLDTNGNMLWSQTYNSPPNGYDAGNGIAVDIFGNVYVTGYEQRNDLFQSYNVWIRKYSPNGTPIWTETYDGPANDYDGGNGIHVDANGNVYVAGSSTQSLAQGRDIWVRKYRQ